MGTECSISDLPGEILAHIFSFYENSEGPCELLKNISNVCKQWNEVCKFPSLWKCVDDPKLTTEQLIELSKGGLLKNTTNLNLSYMQISPENHEHLFQIIGNCENLQLLDMSGSIVKSISEFQKSCPKLRVLKISYCKFDCNGANETNGFPHLEVFVGNKCKELGDDDLYCLLRNSPNLHTLGVNNSRVSCESLLKIPTENIQKLYVSKTCAILSDDFYKVIARWKFTLKELDICQMTDRHLIKVALSSLWENNFSPPLEVLNLSTSKVAFTTLRSLLLNCKHLRYLNVKFCWDLPITNQKIYKTSEELKTVDLNPKFRRLFFPN